MMQSEVVFILLFGLLSSTSSEPRREGLPLLNPGGIGGIFEGPHSETIIQGPDGSEITSEQKGGVVIRDDALEIQPIVVAESQLSYEVPVLTEQRVLSAGPIISSIGSPIIASSGPLLASPSTPLLTGEIYREPVGFQEVPLLDSQVKPVEIVQQDPHIIETEIIEAPDVESALSSDLKGPSGRVITRGSASIVSGPASTTITEPRRIIVAPPKIAVGNPILAAAATIPLNEVPLATPLPAVAASSIALGLYNEASSTLSPQILSYSTTAAPLEYGYSTTTIPSIDRSYADGGESTNIHLGINDQRQSIPVVEYSSSNGIINGPTLLNYGTYSSTESPILSSSIAGISADSAFPTILSTNLIFPTTPHNLLPRAAGLVSSKASPYVQKIPKIEDSIAVDGRVDMGYPAPYYRKAYQLPEVLGMALARFYQKTPIIKDTSTVTIDDKMGDLSQNEITSYDTNQPDYLSQAEYIAPALARNGIDVSQVNLAQVPLSQVSRLADESYRREYDTGYLDNRYQRSAKGSK